MPLLLAKRALNGLAVGERLAVLATDATAPQDFDTFARQSRHVLLDVSEQEGVFRLLLEKR
jgi:tRNA 2-thiouridine synthesizing protein A